MSTDTNADITLWLKAFRNGDEGAHDHLLPRVYQGLRKRASAMMRKEPSDHTLGPTALVHETYLKLIDQDRVDWQDRAHFFAIASTAMRRILVDHARGRQSGKRGGGKKAVSLDDDNIAVALEREEDVLDLDDALRKLEKFDERLAKLVELRFFGGLTHAEIGEVLKVSERTVRSEWTMAKAWLRREFEVGGD